MKIIDSFTGEYGFLSNFEMRDFYSVEHGFQAAKTLDYGDSQWVINAPSPAEAKRRGRSVTLRSDWEQVKEEIMLDLLRKKFSMPSKAQQLGSTGSAHLIEGNWWGDTYWGVSFNTGRGQNRLGYLLMEVRAEL